MKQWAYFWGLGLIWGSSFLLIKIAVDELSALALVSYRIGIAAALMFFFMALTGRKLPDNRRDVLSIFFVAVTNVAIPFTLITHAETSINSSLATVLNSSVPLFSLIIAHFAITEEALDARRIAGLVMGYAGIILLMWDGLQAGGSNSALGILEMIGATLSYAVAVIFMRARLRHLDPLTVAGSTLMVAAQLILALTLVTEGLPGLSNMQTDTIFAVLTLGTLNTVVAYFLFYDLIDKWGARATMVTYLFPPVGIVLGALFLDEHIGITLVLGAAMILSGVVIVNYRSSTKSKVTALATQNIITATAASE